MEKLGKGLSSIGDDPLAVDFEARNDLHRMFGTASDVARDGVTRGLEEYFPTLPCLRPLCDWLSGPDFVFNELIRLRGYPSFGICLVIDKDKAVPLCRKLLSYLFRFDLGFVLSGLPRT